jgi:hypothetical protein
MERTDQQPDIRFWTSYDYFMFEREARSIRRRELRALFGGLWRKATTRLGLSLRNAGAQPVKA